MTTPVEAALRRHRAITIGALVALALLAWGWMFAGAGMGMDPLVSLAAHPRNDPGMPGMAADGVLPAALSAPWRFALTFSMWWVMMVAMMLPSAAPTMLLYARAAADSMNAVRPATESFLAGYLVVWGLFSLTAAMLQLLLERIGLLSQMIMASESRLLSAAILLLTGIYQLSPLKQACLRHCRSPAQFLSRHFRPGHAGALRMGMLHGAYCVGCCWMLMALLFVGGVMNLGWIALLTLLVAAEKLLPSGRYVAMAAGTGCIAWGAIILFS